MLKYFFYILFVKNNKFQNLPEDPKPLFPRYVFDKISDFSIYTKFILGTGSINIYAILTPYEIF